MKPTPFGKLCKSVGFNLIPNGILMDSDLRQIYKPITHTIRDWQHTFCQDGVANSAIAAVIHAIADHGLTLKRVRSFSLLCNLPSKYGKVHENWLGDNRMRGETIASFPSIVLSLVPIVWLFLEKFCSDNRDLDHYVRMFKLLHIILGVFATGAEEAIHHVASLRRTMSEFHELANHCFRLKPKMHHMHHVVDGCEWLGKLLSCFVTERKHRLIKDSALHVMRHIEHTVLADVINSQCNQMSTGTTLWREYTLVNPKPINGVPGFHGSTSALTPCGFIRSGDIVWCTEARCCRVSSFYETPDGFFAAVAFLTNQGPLSMFAESATTNDFIDIIEFVDAVTWYVDSPGIIKVVIPPLVLIA